jgi:hypothetical protein
MSAMQQAMWLNHELLTQQGRASALNIGERLDLKGKLNLQHLRQALYQLVKKIELLRTLFRLGASGMPLAVVAQLAHESDLQRFVRFEAKEIASTKEVEQYVFAFLACFRF